MSFRVTISIKLSSQFHRGKKDFAHSQASSRSIMCFYHGLVKQLLRPHHISRSSLLGRIFFVFFRRYHSQGSQRNVHFNDVSSKPTKHTFTRARSPNTSFLGGCICSTDEESGGPFFLLILLSLRMCGMMDEGGERERERERERTDSKWAASENKCT